MNFSNQIQLNQMILGMNVYNPSSPTAVEFGGDLYLFYAGSGQDGIYYSIWNGDQWSDKAKIAFSGAIQISWGTSPYAIVFNNLIYVFYSGSDNGNSLVCYSKLDPATQEVSAPVSISFAWPYSSSSPSATVFNNSLYLFWNGGANDGIWYSTISATNSNWTPQVSVAQNAVIPPRLGMAGGSSPAAVTYGDSIYLFYNGDGNDGTWYVTYNGNTSNSWSAPSQVQPFIDGLNVAYLSSPAACVTQNGSAISLFWEDSFNTAQIWYSVLDQSGNWSAGYRMICPNDPPGILGNTIPAAMIFSGTLNLFWNGSENDGIWQASQSS